VASSHAHAVCIFTVICSRFTLARPIYIVRGVHDANKNNKVAAAVIQVIVGFIWEGAQWERKNSMGCI